MKLKKITLCGFRGFNKNQSISLDNNVILFYGGNGVGKSSLVEALEWMFYNEISRKTRSLCRSEYTADTIKNIHYDDNECPAFVELEIEKDGKIIILKKEFLSATQYKYSINNQEVIDFSSLKISLDNVYKPILGQSEIRRFVDTEQKDRWDEISKILGLENISLIRNDLLNLRNDLYNDYTFKEISSLKDSIIYDLNQIQLQEFISLINMNPFSKITFLNRLLELLRQEYSQEYHDISSYKQLIENQLKVIIKLSSATDKLNRLNYKQNQELEKEILKLTMTSKKLIGELEHLKDLKLIEIEFLKNGLEIIKDDLCPFCKEKTITEKKRTELTEELKNKQEQLIKYDKYKNSRNELCIHKNGLVSNIKQTLTNPTEVILVIEELSRYPEFSDSVKQLIDYSKNIKILFEKIDKFSISFDMYINFLEKLPTEEDKINECQEFINSIDKMLKEIIGESVRHGATLNKIKDELIQKTSGLSETEKLSLNKIQSILKIINNQNKLIMFGVYNKKIDDVTILIDCVEKFEKQKSKELLKELSASIKYYYNELNPNEDIKFEEIVPSEGRSRKAKIIGNSYGKEINPVSCFSEAHTNCLGLSLYFPQRVDNNPYWNFILLDDPVQSMDQDHSKNLIRILKKISSGKQVIVLSHSHSFKQDFEDLFYGVDYLGYDFSAYQKEGPKLTLMKGSIDNCLDFAEALAYGNSTERQTAGSNTRKALENFTADILIQKQKMGIGRVNNMKLDERLNEIEELGLLSTEEISEIRALLNVIDPTAHGRPRRDASTAEIQDGIKLIKKLKKDHL